MFRRRKSMERGNAVSRARVGGDGKPFRCRMRTGAGREGGAAVCFETESKPLGATTQLKTCRYNGWIALLAGAILG